MPFAISSASVSIAYTSRHVAHFDCFVIDRVHSIDSQSQVDQNEDFRIPFLLPCSGSDHLGLIHCAVDTADYVHTSWFKLVDEFLYRSRCCRRSKPFSHRFAQSLTFKSKFVNRERRGRSGSVEKEGEQSSIGRIRWWENRRREGRSGLTVS